eukprot:SAG22_NODE_157_length_16986_cov_17.230177_5_plen_574_part_00
MPRRGRDETAFLLPNKSPPAASDASTQASRSRANYKVVLAIVLCAVFSVVYVRTADFGGRIRLEHGFTTKQAIPANLTTVPTDTLPPAGPTSVQTGKMDSEAVEAGCGGDGQQPCTAAQGHLPKPLHDRKAKTLKMKKARAITKAAKRKGLAENSDMVALASTEKMHAELRAQNLRLKEKLRKSASIFSDKYKSIGEVSIPFSLDCAEEMDCGRSFFLEGGAFEDGSMQWKMPFTPPEVNAPSTESAYAQRLGQLASLQNQAVQVTEELEDTTKLKENFATLGKCAMKSAACKLMGQFGTDGLVHTQQVDLNVSKTDAALTIDLSADDGITIGPSFMKVKLYHLLIHGDGHGGKFALAGKGSIAAGALQLPAFDFAVSGTREAMVLAVTTSISGKDGKFTPRFLGMPFLHIRDMELAGKLATTPFSLDLDVSSEWCIGSWEHCNDDVFINIVRGTASIRVDAVVPGAEVIGYNETAALEDPVCQEAPPDGEKSLRGTPRCQYLRDYNTDLHEMEGRLNFEATLTSTRLPVGQLLRAYGSKFDVLNRGKQQRHTHGKCTVPEIDIGCLRPWSAR